jgi:two-component system, LytTR family, response regulator
MIQPYPHENNITLSVTEGVLKFNPSDIIRMEASSNYTFIYFLNRRPLLVAKVLKDLESMLASFGFIRTHRSHLVNKAHVAQVDENGLIIMRDESRAEISRRKKTDVKRKLILV